MFVPHPHPKLICWNPNSCVIVLRSGAFGRWLSHDGRALGNEISAFIKKEIPEKPLTPLLPREDTANRRRSMNQEAGLHQTLNSPGPWSWTSQFPALWEINCLLFKSPSLKYFCHRSWRELRQPPDWLLVLLFHYCPTETEQKRESLDKHHFPFHLSKLQFGHIKQRYLNLYWCILQV